MEVVTETKVFVKEHWVLLLGGAIGLYVVFKYMGNSSNSSSQTTDSIMYAQSAQYSAASAANALQEENLQNQYALANKSLDVQNAQGNNATQVAWLQAQGDAAMKTAGASAALIAAMNGPANHAIDAGGAVTVAGLNASAGVAAAGFNSQTAAVTAAANVINTSTAANALVSSQRIKSDAEIAMSNNQVSSTALMANAKIQEGYFGAVGTIANNFLHPSGQVNYGMPGGQSAPGVAQQPAGQPANGGGSSSGVANSVLNNFGGSQYGDYGYTSMPVGAAAPDWNGTDNGTIFGPAGYG